jgi:hypothetical protein
VDQRYLALTAGPRHHHRGDGGGDGGAASDGDSPAASPPPSESEAPVTRWSEVARRIRPFVGGHVTPFNDVHVALALVDGVTARHYDPLLRAAGAAGDLATATALVKAMLFLALRFEDPDARGRHSIKS